MGVRTSARTWVVWVLGFVGLVVTGRGVAHERLSPEDVRKIKDGTYADRLQRLRRLAPQKMAPGLLERATYKLKREALRAQGLAPAEISRRLFGGRAMAFPYAAQPELRSTGTVRTVTVLVDFKDSRAADVLPGMTAATIAPNIYGGGTAAAAAFAPFESVNAYYARASQGKVNIRGDVLGWYHFPKDRAAYEPNVQGLPEEETGRKENQAIFDIVSEALSSFDGDHDFAQYDNDNDGDIDLVTILYAGPNTGWGTFWWAYRWEFFVPDSFTIRFDGKRVKQFVFQFVDRRAGSDFAPNTLIHETGHAFGLPDYYDYLPGEGPDGGVGGLDMMDANQGNHNAFSRWLLDWIEPDVVGDGPPVARPLTASGSTRADHKAIAIFPRLTAMPAPDQELFVIENRARVGNDVKLPGEGLVVWHVIATPNASGNGFALDNSYTPRKLIQLIRADNAADFADGETAGPTTFFRAPREFTPHSSPSSGAVDGTPTNVAVTQIGGTPEVMTAVVGILPSGAGELPAGGVRAAGPPAGPPAGAAFDRTSREVRAALASRPQDAVDVGNLETLLEKFRTATPEQMAHIWRDARASEGGQAGSRQSAVLLQLILTQWAARDGQAAVKALLDVPNGDFVREAFPRVMEAWAGNNPVAAGQWYFADAQAELRSSTNLIAGERFVREVVAHTVRNNLDKAITAIDKLRHVPEVLGALDALGAARDAGQVSAKSYVEKLKAVKTNSEVIDSLRQFREAMHILREHIVDPATRAQMETAMRQHIDGTGTREAQVQQQQQQQQ